MPRAGFSSSSSQSAVLRGQDDRFGFTRAEFVMEKRDVQGDTHGQWSRDDVGGQGQARLDFVRDGIGDDDFAEEVVQQPELLDLAQRDERARIAYDERHRSLSEACSAAHSSSVMSKNGIPRAEAR